MDKSTSSTVFWRFLGIAFLNALLFFSSQFHSTTLPLYLHNLSGSDTIVGVCTAVGIVAALIIRPVTGVAVDRIGRVPVLLVGSILMALTFSAYAVFHSITAVILIRFLYGFTWGIATTASNTIATDLIPSNRFGEWMGYFTLSQSFSMAIAPSIALSIMEKNSFGVLMLAAAGLACIVVVLSFFFWQKRVKQKDARLPFQPYERSALRPAILMLFVGIALGSTFSFAILFGKSMQFAHVGAYFTCFAGTLFIGRPLVGRVIDNYGFRAVILSGFLGFAGSLVMLWQTGSEGVFLLAAALQGVAYGAVQNGLQTMAVVSAPPERRGAANATYFSGFDAGIGVGSLLAGILAEACGYVAMFGIFVLPLLLGAAVYLLTEQHHGKGVTALANAAAPDFNAEE